MAPPPNFIKGVGRLATDRYDFQDHLEGINPPGFTDFRHTADQIDMNPPVLGGATTVQSTLNDVATFIAAQAGAGQGFVTVGSGYDTYHNANGQQNFDPNVPSLDTLLNPVFASIVAFQAAVAAGSGNPPPVTTGFERIKFGGIVVIEAGTYIVRQPINVPPGITLLGEGYGTKIVNATNLNTSILPPQVRTPSLITASTGSPVLITVSPPLPSLVNGSYINISNAGSLGNGSGTWTISNVTNITNVSTSFTLNNNSGIPASNFIGGLVTTMAPVFIIDQDNNRIAPPGDDGAVDTNLFMFSEETKIANMVIADNFVEPTALGDPTNYRLPQNYTSSTYLYPPPLIQQTAGSSLILDGVILMGRASINNTAGSGVVSAVTGTAIDLVSEWLDGYATAFASPSVLKVVNCFIDGFSAAILFFSTNGGADYLEVNNSKIRAYGYFDGYGTNVGNNFMFGINDSTTKIVDNILYANTPAMSNIGTYVLVNSTVGTVPAKQARGKLTFATNDLVVSKIFTPSNSVNSSISNIAVIPTNISNYLSIFDYGNNLQDQFDLSINGTSSLQITTDGIIGPNNINIVPNGLALHTPNAGINLSPNYTDSTVGSISGISSTTISPTINLTSTASSVTAVSRVTINPSSIASPAMGFTGVSSAIVEISTADNQFPNSGSISIDAGTSLDLACLSGPILITNETVSSSATGSTASITVSGTVVTLTGGLGFNANAAPFATVVISNALNSANNGIFTITSVVSNTSITYTNLNTQQGADGYNGSIIWEVYPGGTINVNTFIGDTNIQSRGTLNIFQQSALVGDGTGNNINISAQSTSTASKPGGDVVIISGVSGVGNISPSAVRIQGVNVNNAKGGGLVIYPLQGTVNTQHVINAVYPCVCSTPTSGANVQFLSLFMPNFTSAMIEIVWTRRINTGSFIGSFPGNRGAILAACHTGSVNTDNVNPTVAYSGGSFDVNTNIVIGTGTNTVTFSAVPTGTADDWQIIVTVNLM